jgi:hypothetical protein
MDGGVGPQTETAGVARRRRVEHQQGPVTVMAHECFRHWGGRRAHERVGDIAIAADGASKLGSRGAGAGVAEQLCICS